MKLQRLSTIGLASALLFSTGVLFSSQAEANNVTLSTQSISNKQSDTNLLSQGNFVTVEQDHPTEGTATIIEENGQRYLQFDENFTTARGPAVKVVLHNNNSVPVNLQEENYLTIAPLQSFDGTQKYLIPEDIDLDQYQSVAIWCEQFNVTFGYAAF